MSSPHLLTRRRARNVAVAIVPLLMTPAVVLLAGGEARADSGPPDAFGFSAEASADAMKMDVETGLFGDAFPGVPAGEPPLTGSAAHTEAVYDDLGNNTSLASAPYPGSFAVGMPGLLRAVSRPGGQPGIGQAPPLPNWPFIVSSTYPGREKSAQVNGPYEITATSGPSGSAATARVGVVGGAALLSPASSSTASWDQSSGQFVAAADGSFAAFSLDPLLLLGDVESHAVLTAAPGAAKPTMSSSFEVGTITVAGVKVGLTDKGFMVGPSTQPRPDLGPLAGALAAAGITVEFLPAEATPNGISSAGLRITSTQTFPVQGPVKQTWTAGRVSASLDPGTAYEPFSAYASDEPGNGEEATGCQPGWTRFGEECYPNVAIITPTLGFVSFGATFGGPILCFMGTSALLGVGRGAGAAAVTNELANAVTPYCSSGPNQFGDGLAQLDKQLGPLTAINPVVNPVLDTVADGFRSFGTSMGAAIAPFGPSAREMGAFIEYFKGS